jgi:hypothetical protein
MMNVLKVGIVVAAVAVPAAGAEAGRTLFQAGPAFHALAAAGTASSSIAAPSAKAVVVTLADVLSFSYERVCEVGTWSQCGVAVKQALDERPSDPREVLNIALAWGAGYDKQFDRLRRAGRLESSTPDSEKIYEAVKDKLDPKEIAKDRALEALVKKHFARAAPVLEFANGPIAAALFAFFDSSEIASDYDELRHMNVEIQKEVVELLGPALRPDWRPKLQNAVQQAVPQLMP